MSDSSGWVPPDDKAIKNLIRQTIAAAGDIPADQLPHLIRDRLRDQALDRLDIEAWITEIMRESRPESACEPGVRGWSPGKQVKTRT